MVYSGPSMRTFANWSALHTSRPRRWETPETEEQASGILVRAAQEGRAVKVIGSGHSWSDIAVPADVAIDSSRLSGVVAVDEAAGTITVRGGTKLEHLTEALDARGLAMPILGSIAKQSIAGAIATGTHGSSLQYGNLASLVTSLTLLTPRGDRLVLGPEDPRLEAARVHLGALGLVSEVTLRVVPAFTLLETREVVPFRRVVEELQALAGSATYVKIWWFASTEQAVVFRYERTTRAARHSSVYHFVDERVVNRTLFDWMLRLAGRYPDLTKHINAAVAATYLRPGERVARSDRAFNLAMPPSHREAEWAFAMPDAAVALGELQALIERRRLRINFPCEIRFVRRDEGWMSPAYGADVCHIGVYQAQSPDLDSYFDGASAIARQRSGRPHWGKEHDFTAAQIAAVYPRASDFLALCTQLDPSAVMENAYLARVLGQRRPR